MLEFAALLVQRAAQILEFEILEFYSIFSAMTSPNAGICSIFSAMRRSHPGICSTLSEFLQCLTATRPPHRALTAENSGFPPFWGSLRRGMHIISDCGNHFRGCENLWHHCVQEFPYWKAKCPETPIKRDTRLKNEIGRNLGKLIGPPLICIQLILKTKACHLRNKLGDSGDVPGCPGPPRGV